MINIKGVTKSFEELSVLKGIDLHIEKGKIFGLVGRSGTGKSTLLRCINGLETYDKGSLTVDGMDLNDFSKKDMMEFRKDIGMIFQQFSLLDRLSVYENIALPLRCWKYDNSYIDKKVKELLDIIGIPDKINSRPKELSGGQKQRVAIARALAMNPKLLLCDEATSALDPKTSKSIIELLSKINKDLGITIIVVTHEMSVVKSICEEIAILEDGKVEVAGSTEEIFLNQPQALKNLMGDRNLELPKTGTNIEIFFSKENSSKPIITMMARELDIDYLILGGELESSRDSALGSVIINLASDKSQAVYEFLDRNHFIWKKI